MEREKRRAIYVLKRKEKKNSTKKTSPPVLVRFVAPLLVLAGLLIAALGFFLLGGHGLFLAPVTYWYWQDDATFFVVVF